jgi:hypothetical protein
MRQHVMADPPRPLGAERVDVDRRDHDLLALARQENGGYIVRVAPWFAATTYTVFSAARARLNSVHQSIGGVAPQGSM